MQVEQLAAKVEALGLTDKESRVYVANLFLGPAPVQKIAEQAGINRATTYVILDQLAALGLVTQSVDKKSHYVAESPESLDRLFSLQKQTIEQRQKELRALLPQLQQLERSTAADAPIVRFYKGLEGTKSISDYLRRTAKPKSTIYGFSNVDEILKIFPSITKENPKNRIKKKLASNLIYSWQDGELGSGPKVLRQSIKLNKPIAADITLYEEKCTLMTYEGENSIGVVIESKEIVRALRQLFELAWAEVSKTKK